jgi:integrase
MAKGWYWRNNIAYYDFCVNGKRYKGSLGIRKDSGDVDGKTPTERADAETRLLLVQYEQQFTVEQIWEQTQKRLLGNTAVEMSYDAIWQEFQKKGLSHAKPERQELYCGHLKQFLTWMYSNYPKLNNISLITPEHAKEYITWLRKEDGAPSTKNDKLITLKMIFSKLNLASNPFAQIKPMPAHKIPRNIFTPQQIKILFEESTGWMRQLFITALATFQREGDCCLIKKSYINLDTNRIVFPFTSKTGQDVSLPMLPLFRDIVLEALNDSDNNSEYLFPELAKRYNANPGKIGTDVKEFLKQASFNNTQLEVKGYVRKLSMLDVHSLRHTAAVMAVLSGWPIAMVMKATGHRSLQMVMRYIDHISEEQKENYFFQFGKELALPVTDISMDRKRLAELAYTLPDSEVKRLLALLDQPKNIMLPENP